jgi:Zn-dependent peptidase ImmA (M78 family)/transcriptional regulator with XRE-family HTH domain
MALGDRLKERRDRAGLTQGEAARALRVPRELISMWETEARTPGFGQLEELARLYRVNVTYLAGEEELDEKREREVLFRGLNKNPEARLELERWLDFLDGWADLLDDLGVEEALSGPGRPPKELRDWGQTTDSRRAPTLAAEARKAYGLGPGPIPDLYAFLDEWGVLVYRAALGSISGVGGGISGAFYNHPRLGYCILVNSDTTPGRQAFTLAHEFAHALFHYPSRGLISWKGYGDPKERFADVFAAHFLVPTKQLKKLAEDERQRGGPDPYEALQLASYFRVSYATLLYRLLEEKIVDREHHEWLKGYSPSQMAWYLDMDPDEFRIPEHKNLHLERYPVSVIERIKRAVEHDELTPPQAAGLLDVDVHTLQRRIKLFSDPPLAADEEKREFEELPF